MARSRSGPEAAIVALTAGALLLTACLDDGGTAGTAPTTDRVAAIDRSVTTFDAAPTTVRDGTTRSTSPSRDEPSGSPSNDDDQPSETLVAHVIGEEIVAYAGPASRRVVGSFANPNRHGSELVFQSLAEPGSDLIASGWLPVLLPMRPNGTVGWIRTGDVELTRNPYRIEVDVDDFTLTVLRGDDVHFRTVAGIGEGDTPTPYGSFYLTDLLRPSDPAGIYGPYAFGLSGFSESLTSFNGGAGVIGIHGTNQPAGLGTRVSHGCIRVANASITEMATFLPLGTPVVIGDDPSRAGVIDPDTARDR